ncbi:MAG: bifunctional adenosylcobinamide kinase/adenosylcobinamide-phosphate guanylyltransferase [Deltaproteobacteria bacterium]|nr:bifunctional adenosylcobinamide kinase/adenosylcobinamide-phosphate guanylyltransferase [Deltaproteobacteria bacterium]MBM4322389.1 bifunctional adenosylcobinamide kinase/adenosylcobinamide-phosphate guanylyltransferase [Deltaproteobacteria bacterium]
MGREVILITGGCRSGKSRFALDYADRHFSKKVYLATAEVLDEEMARRVEMHQKMRGPGWQTIEEPLEIVNRMRSYREEDGVILLDCITLWLSNLLLKWDDDQKVMEQVEKLMGMMKEGRPSMIVVSNEVGMSIVPADPLSRRFRDLSGMANQRIGEVSDIVIFMVSGIPIFLKGKE